MLSTRFCRKCGRLFTSSDYPFPISDEYDVCYKCFKKRNAKKEEYTYEETK